MLYTRYIFNKTLTSYGAIIALLVSLIWFSRAISFVKYVTENGIDLSKFFYLFVLILPWLLLFIIPVSLFAAIVLIYNKLITSNEITILKNSGLTKAQISKPIVSLAILSSIFCYFISLYLMPYANKQLRLLRIDFKTNYASLAFKPQTFETLNNLTIYAKNRDENNNLYGILLHDERFEDYSLTITAKNGNIVVEDASVLLYMEDGTVQKFNYDTNKSEILDFDSYIFNLTESNKVDGSMRWKAKERYLHELINPEEGVEERVLKRFRTEIHQRFTYPLLPIILSMIALSCILRGSFSRRGNTPNIILSISLMSVFLGSTITIYKLIENSEQYVPILYANFIIFFIITYYILTENYRKK